jgi:putative flavoprotein involved in K+ transport
VSRGDTRRVAQPKASALNLPSKTDTVVVGAGHSGLIMSALLAHAGREHVVLERRSTVGGGWQDRWDSFCLVTPNWSTSFPDFRYEDGHPGGFMARDEIVRRVARYEDVIGAPVVREAGVRRLALHGRGGFRIETEQGVVDADHVVVATGSFHEPRIPPIAAGLPARLTQLHTQRYRSETSLPPGGVLVVGSGQSGVQIAEELAEAGRRVFISVGSAGRFPRRYRGRDIFEWIALLVTRGEQVGIAMPTVEKLPDPRAKFAGNPALSGRDGGHDTNLREFAARGMTLVGRIESVAGERLALAPDLHRNLARADAFFSERMQPLIERFIQEVGIDAPPDDRVSFTFEPAALAEMNLAEADVSTVIWATGYRLAFDSWIEPRIFDQFGYPRQQRGVTDVPGLYFVGLLWQHSMASATLPGVGLEARHIAGEMGLPLPPLVGLSLPGLATRT